MAITAYISSDEVTAQVTNRFVDQYFECRLINTPGTVYEPGVTDDANFLTFEAPVGTAGYQRQTFSYASGDVSTYADDGVGLEQKATIFAHYGGGTVINFSHAAVVWSTGNTLTLGTVDSAPTAGVDGTYTNIPIDVTSGSGEGLTVDLTISNSGAASTDYAITLAKPGYNYAPGDTLGISEGVLAGLGAVTAGAGGLGFTVGTTYAPSNAGKILCVAATTSPVTLSGGNEAVFYWNLKQFGFFTDN
jgi:hypothetical protein